MTDFVSVNSRSSALFNQALAVSILQPLVRNQADYKAYRTKVNLKINEQRNETSGEKELRLEISKSDDFEFLFAETLNNDKYQQLAREHDLTVDFDAFPRAIIQKLLTKNIAIENENSDGNQKGGGLHSFADNKPTEITLMLDAEKTTCHFELFSKTPISKGRIFSIKLEAVRGDQLTSHLLRICSMQALKLNNFKEIMVELESLREKVGKLNSENNRLKQFEESHKNDLERIEELEYEFELVKEERSNVRLLVEEKNDEINTMNQITEELKEKNEEISYELKIVEKMLEEEQVKVDRLYKEKEISRREIFELKKENKKYLEEIDKLKYAAKKYLLNGKSENEQQSVDLRKLNELNNVLKEKEEIITTLTEKNEALQKSLEDEKKKLSEIEQNMEQLRKSYLEHQQLNQNITPNRLDYYSSNPVGQPHGFITDSFPRKCVNRTIFDRSKLFKNNFGISSNLNSPLIPENGIQFQPVTPNALRNLTNYTNDTTASTNTPILDASKRGI